MARLDDHAYYATRAIEEMAYGDRAPDAIVAAVHYELAYRYSTLTARPVARAPNLKLVESGAGQLSA